MMNEEEEEIFMRPIQKHEIIKLLKQYHLLEEKNVKPLGILNDNDFIDIDLAAFYWNLLVNKNGGGSSRKSESTLSKMRESITNISDYDLDILDNSDTLEKIQWSELMEPKNDDKFEEFENTLMQLDDSLVASSWEKASLKIFEEYAKIVLQDKETQGVTDNEIQQEESEQTLKYILVEKHEQNNKMKKVLDLDKRIKELMDELGDEKKARTSLNANSVLNDTLEEMEVLMKCGESYMTRESIIKTNTSFARSKSDDSIFEKPKTPPANKLEKISQTPPVKRKAPRRKFKPTKVKSSPSATSTTSEFKVPNARPQRRPIHSPIGDYIKNSGTTPLIKKVVSTPLSGPVKLVNKYREVLRENVNSTPIKLPTKTYKPAAQNVYVEKENDPKIPKNIHKLYTAPIPEIIRHIGHVTTDTLPSNAIKSNFEDVIDLTVLEDTQIENETENSEQTTEVSLYVSKQALHSNSLQNNCN